MRAENPQPKVKEVVAIPKEFAAFISDVHQLIVDRDEAALIESDDLLQCDSAYGGLLTEGGTEYGFTYFPEKGIRVKWRVILGKDAIERVAKGELKDLTLWGCKDSACGCKFSEENGSCFYCDWVEVSNES